MGQLERYGLYVLVLVIFLILGVAIWGNDPQAPTTPGTGQPLDVRKELESSARLEPRSGGDSVAPTKPREEAPAGGGISGVLGPQFEGDDGPFVDDASFEDVRAEPNLGSTVAKRGVESEPEPEPETPAPSARPALRDYTIQKGDTLWDIARRELGSGAEVATARIMALNPGIDPGRLQAGHTIKLPPRLDDLAKSPGAGGLIYVVRSGDNPSTIAQKLLGSQKYAAAIMKANGIDDARTIKEGAELVIPRVGQRAEKD